MNRSSYKYNGNCDTVSVAYVRAFGQDTYHYRASVAIEIIIVVNLPARARARTLLCRTSNTICASIIAAFVRDRRIHLAFYTAQYVIHVAPCIRVLTSIALVRLFSCEFPFESIVTIRPRFAFGSRIITVHIASSMFRRSYESTAANRHVVLLPCNRQ